MIPVILTACGMVAVTVLIHAAGSSLVLRWLRKSGAGLPTRFGPVTWLLIRLVWSLILIHLAEVTIWALCYLWTGCVPDAESALYFSGVTYTTIGYGDLLLPKTWRLLGPVEGLTGILMCGLSAGFFFALVSRIYASRPDAKQERIFDEAT
jgi:hypothetical protein